MKKYILSAIFLVAAFMWTDRIVHTKSTRFSLSKITTSQSSPELEIPPIPNQAEIDAILTQKFTYFDKGSQSYVFISEDGKHVLKFLKQNKLAPLSWLAYLPFSFNPHYQHYKSLQAKRQRTLRGAKIAFMQFKEETGVEYVHLNKTSNLRKDITVIDKKGKKWTVPLDKVTFTLQTKVDLAYARIADLMSQHKTEEAKKTITAVFSLIDQLGKKGVVDNDLVVRKNVGIINGKAIQIDTACMRVDPAQPLRYKSNIAHSTSKFRKWIETNYPEIFPHFEQTVETLSSQPTPGI
jgi:hypothetical protein